MPEAIPYKNPFVGLRAFEEEEDYLFFGRSAEIKDLLKKFSNSRFLAVIGSSGSGKSSLVKSGLLPSIYSGFLSVGHNWRVALLRPGNNPIGNLANALAKPNVLFETPELNGIPCEPIIESTLRRSSNGLNQVYKQARLSPTDNLLIVIDQFEELFRFSQYEKQFNQGVSDSLNFINLLLNATQQHECPVYVLLTMRSDFLGDCAQFRGLPEAINEGQYLVPRMTRDEVKEAITGPIAVGGAQITQSLLTRLLNDVGNDIDQLPVLQHAMMRTWDAWIQRQQTDTPISLDDYLKIGGMTEALSQHANEIFNDLKTEEQKKYCELIFKALTDKAADVRGTRRPRTVKDLSLLAQAPPADVMSIVEKFRMPGRTFLMPPADIPLDESTVIDISHESLMRVWDKLKTWTDEDVQSAEIFKRLVDASVRESNGLASLWTDPELTQGLNWKARFNDNEELIKVWANSFDADTTLALDFLARSKKKAIEIKEQEEAEAKQKRKDEEAKKNGILMRIAIGILLIALSGATYAYLNIRMANLEAVKKTKEADSAAIIANANYNLAKINLDSARYWERQARLQLDTVRVQKDSAEFQKRQALIQKDSAEFQKKVAVNQKDSAESARRRADSLANINALLAKNSAAAQYQKKIREFPTDNDSIKKNNYENIYRLMLYCSHLDDLRTNYKIADSKLINHELYSKLYYCLKYRGVEYAITEGQSKSKSSGLFPKNTRDLGNGYKVIVQTVTSSDAIMAGNKTNVKQAQKAKIKQRPQQSDVLLVQDKNNKTVDSLPMKYMSTFFTDKSDNRLIYSTGDNCLYVKTYHEHSKDSTKIPMGGVVTSIGYDAKNNIIYFGLMTGELGYIKFKEDSRNQPVYRNNLGSKITALQAFIRNDTNYLFATSYDGKAVVYELDISKIRPDSRLDEIEFPEYKGVITNAAYDADNQRLVLVTSKGSYWSWNPFTNMLLEKLKQVMSDSRPLPINMSAIQKECNLYNDKQ